ncbi:MAG: TOBE domain-containing protein [Thermoplasmata archaeon]|nr:TOBE domain-containing protein [Thermoplasmata archaeon]
MRAHRVTDADVALLRTLSTEHSVVAASRRVGISRDRATYRIARMERAFGGPVVDSVRGGRGHGGSRLTPLGDRIIRQGFDSVELLQARPMAPLSHSNLFHGVYRSVPAPEVLVGRGVRLRVAFAAEDGEPVAVLLDPEAILLARGKFPSSARNVIAGTVRSVGRRAGPRGSTIVVQVGALRLRAAVTAESVGQLRLRPGARVWLYVKATALRRVSRPPGRPTPGSRRS